VNPTTGRFQPITEEQVFEFHRNEGELADAHRRHGIKQAQIFSIGEEVEIKGARYRVKSIHTKSIVFEYAR
jgi:uncharacterized Zn finger protein